MNAAPHRPLQAQRLTELKARVKEAQGRLNEVAEELEHRTAGGARKLLLELRPEPRDRSHNIYVIEMDDSVREQNTFRDKNDEQLETGLPCLYVGMTSLTPEQRFDQHKSGIRAARYVKRYGLLLRPEFYLAVNPMLQEEAKELEKELAARLRRAGYPTWQN